MTKAHKIVTVRDAMMERLLANEIRSHKIQVRELTKKVRHWEQKVVQFGGEIQKQTLAKFQSQLNALVGTN